MARHLRAPPRPSQWRRGLASRSRSGGAQAKPWARMNGRIRGLAGVPRRRPSSLSAYSKAPRPMGVATQSRHAPASAPARASRIRRAAPIQPAVPQRLRVGCGARATGARFRQDCFLPPVSSERLSGRRSRKKGRPHNQRSSRRGQARSRRSPKSRSSSSPLATIFSASTGR